MNWSTFTSKTCNFTDIESDREIFGWFLTEWMVISYDNLMLRDQEYWHIYPHIDLPSTKTLFSWAVLSEIVTIPKGCRFQKRSKTTSRTIQRLPTIIIITSYDHHQGQKTQITLIFDFLQHSLDQYARYIHSGDSKIRIQVGHN